MRPSGMHGLLSAAGPREMHPAEDQLALGDAEVGGGADDRVPEEEVR